MPRIKLTLEYDGTDYVGWQVQANGPSVQARLEAALSALTGAKVPVTAAGRTDSGVHAEGQLVAFDTPAALPLKAYTAGLNALLPADIAAVAAEEVAADFDPRRWARWKRYRYRLANRRARSPLLRRTHWHVFAPLDVDAMRAAAACLVGRHDFSAFRAADCQARHAVRELLAVELDGERGGLISVAVTGTAFLKHMVRNLVGSLVEVGRGRRTSGWMKDILDAGRRELAGPTAPAHGLVLEVVAVGDGPRGRASQGVGDVGAAESGAGDGGTVGCAEGADDDE